MDGEEGDETIDDTEGTMEEFEEEVQDESERRLIRARYRELINDSTEQRENVGVLSGKISEANRLFEQVQMAREARLDSQVMNVCAAAVTEKAHALHTGFMQFSNSMFLDKIKQRAAKLRNDETANADAPLAAQDWVNLGKDASYLFRRAPSFHFMLGTLQSEQPQRTPKAARQKKATVDPGVAKATVPDKVKEMGKSDQETTTEEVERVLAILRRLYQRHGQPICYFEFVMNPNSFEQTVENIFYVAFLVKDGHASVSLDDNGLPIIAPVMQNDSQASLEDIPTLELAVGISRQDWQDIVQNFQIQRALIPPRD